MVCGLASKTKNNNNINTKDDYSHEWIVSKMDEYKEKAFIQDLGLYNDTYPEFYIGSDTLLDDGILTGDLSKYISSTGFPINHYYLHLAEMYEDKKYCTNENGNLILTWIVIVMLVILILPLFHTKMKNGLNMF